MAQSRYRIEGIEDPDQTYDIGNVFGYHPLLVTICREKAGAKGAARESCLTIVEAPTSKPKLVRLSADQCRDGSCLVSLLGYSKESEAEVRG